MKNPYEAPSADDGVESFAPGSGDYVEANNGTRFINLVVDYVAFIVLAFLSGIVIGLLGMGELLIGFGSNIFGLVLMFVYYVGFESTLGATPGKMVTRTKVVDADGGPASFNQILGRTLSRFVPFEPFSFLGSDRGWHDRWSNTRVVRSGL